MIDESEYLLTCLSEESAEVIHAACKALRFGLYHGWPGKGESNRRVIERELADVFAVMKLLGMGVRQEDIDAKIKKLKKYMAVSREVGALEPQKASSKRGGE